MIILETLFPDDEAYWSHCYFKEINPKKEEVKSLDVKDDLIKIWDEGWPGWLDYYSYSD